jgi:hypothetical protein
MDGNAFYLIIALWPLAEDLFLFLIFLKKRRDFLFKALYQESLGTETITLER